MTNLTGLRCNQTGMLLQRRSMPFQGHLHLSHGRSFFSSQLYTYRGQSRYFYHSPPSVLYYLRIKYVNQVALSK
ncbi:hypothetical protein E2562_019817 [Oryza meyeriana var. granulata]|uniref:Uncharacterized protein n=1 Tax=Oryza meyeriana var. granulata TaxID=110450 RepID=A0A6G1DLR0_9ORYZ|nr:hypothetical protein E2562_019817 [Oryza meyeriana var. granulata]